MNIDELKRDISILDVATRVGFHIKRVGNEYTLIEHDSVRVDPNINRFYRFSNTAQGSVIDFVMEFCNINSVSDAMKYLNKEFASYQEQKNERKFEKSEERKVTTVDHKTEKNGERIVELPPKDNNMRNVFAYLLKTRRIRQDVVQAFVDNKMLYQDNMRNAVFVSYDNKKPVFATRRGTNTGKKFAGDVRGNDYTRLFYVRINELFSERTKHHPANKLIITESVIDAMSLMSLDIDYADYLSLCGVAKYDKAIPYYLDMNQYQGVILSLDNDEAGHIARDNIRAYIEKNYPNVKTYDNTPKYEGCKDWNDVLIKILDRKEKEVSQAKRKEETSESEIYDDLDDEEEYEI